MARPPARSKTCIVSFVHVCTRAHLITMETLAMTNKFADALRSAPRNRPEPVRASRSSGNGRGSLKHVGGYFPPAVSKRLRQMATDEDTTVQELLAEALELLFQSRGGTAS